MSKRLQQRLNTLESTIMHLYKDIEHKDKQIMSFMKWEEDRELIQEQVVNIASSIDKLVVYLGRNNGTL